MTEFSPIPPGNIYWRDIGPEDTVIETKTTFKVVKKDGSEHIVFWYGAEAGTAQQWLRGQTIHSK